MATRVVLGALALGVCVLTTACTEAEAREESTEDVLVIELGGDNPPLRESLKALGVVLESEPEPATGPEPRAEPPPRDDPRPDPDPPPPEPRPRAEPEFFTVELKQGETLWDLAQEHLGSGPRWREILALNGWTEARSRRLQPGTTVRIPRE